MKTEIAKKCFIEPEEYQEKFQKLFNNRKIMLIMMCNNLVLRIERLNDLSESIWIKMKKFLPNLMNI